MKAILLIFSAIACVGLAGCVPGAASKLPIGLTLSGSDVKPKFWVDKEGYQPSFQERTECAVISKQSAKAIVGKAGGSIMDMVKNKFQTSMEEDSQLHDCLMSKNYSEIELAPGQATPPVRQSRAAIPTSQVQQAPVVQQQQYQYVPVAPQYQQQLQYIPVAPQHTMQPHYLPVVPQYLPQQQYAPVQ